MKSKIQNYILLIGLLLSSCGQISHEKFDSDKWQNSNLNLEENWNLRWSMMNDLRNNYKLKGQTKKEIIELLGKPENETKNEFYYYLGYSGKGINTGTLTVIFDGNNIVSEIKVHQG